jgi:hypothetical protein
MIDKYLKTIQRTAAASDRAKREGRPLRFIAYEFAAVGMFVAPFLLVWFIALAVRS